MRRTGKNFVISQLDITLEVHGNRHMCMLQKKKKKKKKKNFLKKKKNKKQKKKKKKRTLFFADARARPDGEERRGGDG